jgi:hypothetical protein
METRDKIKRRKDVARPEKESTKEEAGPRTFICSYP